MKKGMVVFSLPEIGTESHLEQPPNKVVQFALQLIHSNVKWYNREGKAQNNPCALIKQFTMTRTTTPEELAPFIQKMIIHNTYMVCVADMYYFMSRW